MTERRRQYQSSIGSAGDFVNHTFTTMTIAGGYGNSYRALSWLDAQELAEADGYRVIDFTDLGDELILVVEG